MEGLEQIADSQNAARTSQRILVVDDSHDAAESLAALVRLWGHEAVVAFDGVAAIEKARSYLPDVVLLDISLPGMNGYEVADALRRDVYLKNTRIFAITGYGLEGGDPVVKDAGFDDVFVKPIDFEVLEKSLIERSA
jgi:CheY-like chemotaxis protein